MLEKVVALRLEEPFLFKEIEEAMWCCDESKVPGSDDFNLFFSKKCWGVVGKNIVKMLLDFH